MRAAVAPSPSPPRDVVFRGKVHRRPSSPAPSSSASASSHESSSSSQSATHAQRASSTIRQGLTDDSDLWASIRLASSPPKASVPRPSDDNTAMLPLVIDDFSFDRMSQVPTVRAPPLTQQPKASSWSIGRRQHHQQVPKMEGPTPTPPLARAQSLNPPATNDARESTHDITLMDHRVFVARDQWVPHRDRRACVVCDRDFGMLRKKHSCRMCGDVVCSRCSLFKNVKLPGVVGESKARVCSRCFLQYRQRVLVKAASSDDADTSSPVQDEQVQEAEHDHDECGSGDEIGYDSADELPSVEDVLRRTAAKVTGFKFPVAPVAPMDFGGRRTLHKPVSLLAPELMESMFRESATISASSSSLNPPSPDHIYGRGPSMVLLSPASSYDLLDVQLFDLDRTRSFSSSISTVSSSLSSLSTASTVSSMRSATEEELVAAMRARELEKEVEASRERIQELERKMQEQENKKAELSLEQQKQLAEARALIDQLQKQLKQQEQDARDAVMARDSICLTNLRQIQQVQQVPPAETSRSTSTTRHRSDSVEAESEALRQKLRLLERQLHQAGINVAEVIPYAVAKQRIIEISRRMTEISDAEAAMKLKNPKGVAALRREYYVLEQDMERFHTALLMSDEYIEEQAAKEREWELGHAQANAQALRTVRSALPVDISRLSEHTLRTMLTPSGKHMSADLARRFKRTNVLQLLRLPPQTIVRMHPSVIESYRTAGLTLIERRALHAALKGPASEWQKQARDEIAQKKAVWFKKLKDAFMQALVAYEHHIVEHHMNPDAQCPFIGKMCLMRAEKAVAQLYATQLGFPEGDEYLQQEIIKSDPEGAGEKALLEAKTQAMAAAKLNARQRELKNHYGLRNVRLVTMAIAALEEMDATMERIRLLDSQAATVVRELVDNAQSSAQWWRLCEDIVNEVRELALQMARRAGICLTGKRDPSKDDADTRSHLEARASHEVACYIASLIEDVAATIASLSVPAFAMQLKNSLPRISEVLEDVHEKNAAFVSECEDQFLLPVLEDGEDQLLLPVLEADGEDEHEDSGSEASGSRVNMPLAPARISWMEREQLPVQQPAVTEKSSTAAVVPEVTSKPSIRRLPTPQSSFLLDAIRAKRPPGADETNEEKSTPMVEPSGAPDGVKKVAGNPLQANDLFAAIRARQNVTNGANGTNNKSTSPVVEPLASIGVNESVPPVVEKAVDNAPKANDMFAAIRARRSAMPSSANDNQGDAPARVESTVVREVEEESTPVVVKKAVDTTPKANDLFAAIRARRSVKPDVVNEPETAAAPSNLASSEAPKGHSTEVVPIAEPEETTRTESIVSEPTTTTDEAPKAKNLLAAIRARKAKVNAVSAVATVDNVVSSA